MHLDKVRLWTMVNEICYDTRLRIRQTMASRSGLHYEACSSRTANMTIKI